MAAFRLLADTRGTIPPGEFISHLEESNQISVVGRWVLDQACHDGAEWHRLGYPLEVSVNLSARQLDTDPIVTDIQAALDRNTLAADHLCVEVTESAMMRDLDMALLRLRAIGSLGVRIAIDDFGTGYSSFAHLERLPVDVLKIDQSFIQRLSNESSARVLVHAQIQLAKALRIETLAEGVEEPYQLDCLKEEACTSAQGFLLCRPLAARAIPDFIVRWDERVAGGVDGVHRVS